MFDFVYQKRTLHVELHLHQTSFKVCTFYVCKAENDVIPAKILNMCRVNEQPEIKAKVQKKKRWTNITYLLVQPFSLSISAPVA